MNSIEAVAAMVLTHGWRLVLAFSAATLCIALLRRPCRHLFGAQRACQLWLIPPLAMLASQWPHTTTAIGADAPLPALVYLITSVASASSFDAGVAGTDGWRVAILGAWVLGMTLVAWHAMAAQRRYRSALDDAATVADTSFSTTLLRASQTDVGPSLVGAWRIRIVVPADFETRYNPAERELILAHERMHANRRDGLWCLLAQVTLAAFWFNPLAWWALGALRHDQELACDAAVLREHPGKRRVYAHAMLKTQPTVHRLPVGCSWSPRHPITERIAMLKQPSPSTLRVRLGLLAGVVLGALISGVVYAASRPSGPTAVQPSTAVDDAGKYQLDIMVASFSKGTDADHAERTTGALCMDPGESGGMNTDHWQLGTKLVALDGGRVSVALDLSTATGKRLASRRLEGRLGQPLLAEFNGPDGEPAYSVDVTSLAGCPARVGDSGAAARLTMIKQTVKNQPVRAVVESMAQRAGLQVVNPQDLSTHLVTLDFDRIPAERALQLMADIDGKRAIFHGKQVRFDIQ